MTTRKQDARDRKRRVHGYVSEPVERTVVEPEPSAKRGFFKSAAPSKERAPKPTSKAVSGPRGKRLSRDGDVIVNGRQRVPPPTWRRTLTRTLIFLPIMWVIVHFLFTSADMSPMDELLLIAMYGVVTIGVMHFSETFRYKRLDKMLTEAGSPPRH
jgi:hypothetical protein